MSRESLVSNPEMIAMMKLGVKAFITVLTINMYIMFRDLKENTDITRKEMKDIKENQVELKGLKNIIFEMKNSVVGH